MDYGNGYGLNMKWTKVSTFTYPKNSKVKC